MHQSIPAVSTTPPPDNRGAVAHVVSPGCGAFAILSRPGDWAFDTRVFESVMDEFFGKDEVFIIIIIKFFSALINVSVGHVCLLSIDRFVTLVTPLQYRVKVTSNRVYIANVICWVYFLLFGCAFAF